ncbi:hypothetical protein BJX65DRAFT_316099 [Aspergillus insuetus]
MSVSEADRFDYIIVGGGLAGSVLASLLLVEAGPDVSKNETIPYANNTVFLIGSELDWGYLTVPQAHLNSRQMSNPASKCLGGGTAINACGWTRGHHAGFDQWAELVGDERYAYKNLLPYFIQTEEYHDANITPGQHGSEGPVYVATPSSTGRRYPLREQLAQAWKENNVQRLQGLDGNAGSPGGLRQLASSVYPLEGVEVLTNTLVKRILIEESATETLKPKAVGIETADGKQYFGREIISAAGEIFSSLDIPVLFENPDLTQYWRLKDPSAGYALGSPNFPNHPEYGLGVPIDWMVSTDVLKDGLVKAIEADVGKSASSLSTHHSLLQSEPASAADPAIALDGSHIASTIVHLLPTSKGAVTISSTDPASSPVLDPHYFSTEIYTYAWRTGLRMIARLFLGTEMGRSLIAGEAPPDAFGPVTLESEDEYLDARVRHGAFSTYHLMGFCSMGKVADSSFRVHGVSNLSVVDASVIPVSIAAHIQATVYALAELAAVTVMEEA